MSDRPTNSRVVLISALACIVLATAIATWYYVWPITIQYRVTETLVGPEGELGEIAGMLLASSASDADILARIERINAKTIDESFHDDTLLTYSVMAERPVIVQSLLEMGANPNGVTASHGLPRTTPLATAIAKDNLELAELLIRSGADPTLQVTPGITMIELAESGGNDEIVESLRRAVELWR